MSIIYCAAIKCRNSGNYTGSSILRGSVSHGLLSSLFEGVLLITSSPKTSNSHVEIDRCSPRTSLIVCRTVNYPAPSVRIGSPVYHAKRVN